MKPILTILLITSVLISNAQSAEQKFAFGKSYRTIIDLTVNYLDNGTVKQRTALAGLKYQYLGTIDGKVYIKFYEITDDKSKAKGDNAFVNENNDDISYFVDEDKLDDYNSQKTVRLVTGTLFAPIKIRPEEDINGATVPWELSTDITLGQYLGFRIPVSKRNPFYLTIPTVTFGTSLLSINSSNTDPENDISTTLGLTWSTGLVLDLNGFNIGFLLGRDYAPGSAGSDWIYNGKTWYSVGFGINLTSKNKDL